MKVLPKIVQILELFSNGDTLPFAEIVERTGLTRSNAAHILSALCETQLLAKSSFGHYCMGEKLYELAGGTYRQNILNMLVISRLCHLCCFHNYNVCQYLRRRYV